LTGWIIEVGNIVILGKQYDATYPIIQNQLRDSVTGFGSIALERDQKKLTDSLLNCHRLEYGPSLFKYIWFLCVSGRDRRSTHQDTPKKQKQPESPAAPPLVTH
jgi:hypothetical protein